MKIVSIKRFIRSILIVLLIIIILSLVMVKSSLSYKEIEYNKIFVSEGDTLWNIAKHNQNYNNYYKNKDIRYIMNDIMRINNLKTSDLAINQELNIPNG